MKKILAFLLAVSMIFAMAACAASPAQTTTEPAKTEEAAATEPAAAEETTAEPAAPVEEENLTETQKIIKEAEGMTLEELAKKAIEESNGKMFYGVGNSSRGKSALPLFIEYLQSIDSSYSMEFEWQQPKNNKIFDQLTADSLKDTGTFAMTLIQDGNQIESKMVQTGILDTFIPKDWADANGTTADAYTGFLPLQTLNKVFMYNCTGDKTYDNCWDFVAEGEHGLYMDIDSEIVGKNFLYMLTRDDYAAWMKESFEALSADEQAYFQPTITEMEADAADLGLGADGAYALAWIKLSTHSLIHASAQTAHTHWHGSSCGSKATTHRPTTVRSATPWSTLLQRISLVFWFTRSSALSKSPAPSPSTTSRLPLMKTAIRVSAATATAITSSSPTTPRCPGPPAHSSLT